MMEDPWKQISYDFFSKGVISEEEASKDYSVSAKACFEIKEDINPEEINLDDI